jgi:hypothetical protein
MFIQESALLGLELGRVALRNNFVSYPKGAGTPAWIIDDSYKDGMEENGIRYSGINVNLSNTDNHFSSKKKTHLRW